MDSDSNNVDNLSVAVMNSDENYNLVDLFRDVAVTSQVHKIYTNGVSLYQELNYNKAAAEDWRIPPRNRRMFASKAETIQRTIAGNHESRLI